LSGKSSAEEMGIGLDCPWAIEFRMTTTKTINEMI